MGKKEAYDEMCKKTLGKDKKYTFTFDEVAEIAEKYMGIPKEETLRKLNIIKSIKEGRGE